MTIKQTNRSWKNTDYLEALFDIKKHETIGLCLKLNYEHFMIFNYVPKMMKITCEQLVKAMHSYELLATVMP